MLEEKQQLKERQFKERQRGGDALAGRGALRVERAALRRADVLKAHRRAADTDRVAALDLGAAGCHVLAVHAHAAAGEHVEDHPAPVVEPLQDGLDALDVPAIDADISRADAPDQVFPVCHRDGIAPEARRGPGLGLKTGGEHRTDAADHDHERKRDHGVF